MNPRKRTFLQPALAVGLLAQAALALGLLAPAALAQKPPTPSPVPPPSAPPSAGPSQPGVPSSPMSQPNPTAGDMVMYLMGRVATSDGTALPNDVKVERMCNGRIRQQVYVHPRGDFVMELGSRADSFVDASADGETQYSQNSKVFGMGISRRELANCELQASLSGFRSGVVNLAGLIDSGDSIDVGAIVVERRFKVEGTTLSALPYKAPKDARKAYENGLVAKKNHKLPEARQQFEKAVKIYPQFTNAWFQLGVVLQTANQKDDARKAYTQATVTDSRFLPPYLSLAFLAFEAENWTEVLNLTNHVLGLDPLDYGRISGYVLDLDSLDYTGAYFYNALANYKLNKLDAAEKSGLRAEYMDLQPRYPQLHLLLAEIFAQKNNYATAISELRIYLDLLPHARDADQVRNRLAEFAKLNGSAASPADKTTQK